MKYDIGQKAAVPTAVFGRCVALLLAVAAAGLPPASAQPSAVTSSQHVAANAANKGAAPRPKIGLALSGGGARGLAHVGVLKELEAARIPIDYVWVPPEFAVLDHRIGPDLGSDHFPIEVKLALK